ncbi:MAG: sugar transferase [Rikenellaceae bacterium]
MNKFYRRAFVIAIFDLFIALFAFWISRYFGDMPRWYFLVLSAVIWVAIGLVTHKLYFSKYKRLRYVFIGLLLVDSATVALLFLLYHKFVEGYEYDYSIILASGIIFALECVLYAAVRQFVYMKIPYFYEWSHIDENIEPIKHILVDEVIDCEDVNIALKAIKESEVEPIAQIRVALSSSSVVLNCSDPKEVLRCEVKAPSLIIHSKLLNHVRHINTLFSFTNYKLKEGGYIFCGCVTSIIRKDRVMEQVPHPLNSIIYFIDYLVHRVIPKLPVVNRLYYFLTKGERRVLTRVEVLGRLYRAGFDIVYERVIDGKFYILAKRIQKPIRHDKPSSGVFIRLKRSGKGGKIIGVYKFRTMHAYSEYLQPYMYKTEGLAKDGGRYGNDYRVNKTGAFMRKVFIDELPMLINWFKGDLKLVGIRPLSSHYLSLYSKELQDLRMSVKPGLFPPFYADRPKSLEEKQISEMTYLNAYLKSPILTDWIYFWRIFRSIIFKGARSE